MRLILSNYGHRLLHQRLKENDGAPLDPTVERLTSIVATGWLEHDPSDPAQREWIDQGLAQTTGDDTSAETIHLRYERNPLEHIERVVFEYTTLCNLACSHCRNGPVKPVTESKVERLREAVDLMVPLGVTRFDFIGGEVSLYGKGWLDLVAHIRRHPGTTACVTTSGWFLGERDFRAAGAHYADEEALLAAWRDAGLTHVIFSLDGPQALHDEYRAVPGLHARILNGFDRVRAQGLSPQVSLVVRPDDTDAWLREVADRLYDESHGETPERKLLHLLGDRMNYASNFIDVGNGANMGKAHTPLREIPDKLLRCKNFFRPFPGLRIQADGEVSLCPLVDAGTGYGNVHARGLLQVLNHLQDAFAFRLHAEDRIADYRPLLDAELFGDHVAHVCTLRTAVTLLARTIDESGIDTSDPAALRAVNEQVARKVGVLPSLERKALGVRRP